MGIFESDEEKLFCDLAIEILEARSIQIDCNGTLRCVEDCDYLLVAKDLWEKITKPKLFT